MNLTSMWPYVLTHGVVAGVVWYCIRKRYRRLLSTEKLRHGQSRQASSRLIQEAKRQLAQLNKDLAAARMQAKRAAQAEARAVPAIASVKPTRPRTQAATARPQPPVNGFADTLPTLQFASDTSFGIH